MPTTGKLAVAGASGCCATMAGATGFTVVDFGTVFFAAVFSDAQEWIQERLTKSISIRCIQPHPHPSLPPEEEGVAINTLPFKGKGTLVAKQGMGVCILIFHAFCQAL